MGLYAARVTDIVAGMDSCHPPSPPLPSVGVLVTGSPNVVSEGLYSSRFGDIAVHPCGCVTIVVSGSPVDTDAGFYASRVTDITTNGCNNCVIISGSPRVLK
jgi:uncharacterized Zn-binding protein involved in type VI secretion